MSDSKYMEESKIFEILRSAQNDRDFMQDDGKYAQDDRDFMQNNGKYALSGCVAKGFLQKSEKDEKTFYKISEDGFKQI